MNPQIVDFCKDVIDTYSALEACQDRCMRLERELAAAKVLQSAATTLVNSGDEREQVLAVVTKLRVDRAQMRYASRRDVEDWIRTLLFDHAASIMGEISSRGAFRPEEPS